MPIHQFWWMHSHSQFVPKNSECIQFTIHFEKKWIIQFTIHLKMNKFTFNSLSIHFQFIKSRNLTHPWSPFLDQVKRIYLSWSEKSYPDHFLYYVFSGGNKKVYPATAVWLRPTSSTKVQLVQQQRKNLIFQAITGEQLLQTLMYPW